MYFGVRVYRLLGRRQRQRQSVQKLGVFRARVNHLRDVLRFFTIVLPAVLRSDGVILTRLFFFFFLSSPLFLRRRCRRPPSPLSRPLLPSTLAASHLEYETRPSSGPELPLSDSCQCSGPMLRTKERKCERIYRVGGDSVDI